MKVRKSIGDSPIEHWRFHHIGTWIGFLAGVTLLNCGDQISAEDEDRLVISHRLDEQIGGMSNGPVTVGTLAGAPSSAAGRSAVGVAGASGTEANNPTDGDALAGRSMVSRFARINEVKIDPPGTDAGFEFIEIAGEPTTSLSNHWLLTIEGDSESNLGQVDTVIDLSTCNNNGPCILDTNGLMLLSSDAQSTAIVDGAAWRKTSEIAKGGLENGTTSLWLIVSPYPLLVGQDWDSDDDGVLEIPNDVTVRDSVAWTDGDANDDAYSTNSLGPKPKVQAAVSCMDALGSRTWRYGQLTGESQSISFDAAHSTPEGLEPFTLSPGATNVCPPLAAEGPTPGSVGNAGSTGIIAVRAAGAAGCPEVAQSTTGGTGTTSSNSDTSISPVTANGGGVNSVTNGGGTPGGGGHGGSASSGATMSRGGLTGGSSDSSRQSTTATSNPAGGTASSKNAAAGCGAIQATVIVAVAANQSGESGWWSPGPVPATAGSSHQPAGSAAHGSSTSTSAQNDAGAPPPMPSGCNLVAAGPADSLSRAGWVGLLLLLGEFARSRAWRRRQRVRFTNRE